MNARDTTFTNQMQARTRISVAGNAALVEDPAMKLRFRTKTAEAWFPGGPQTTNLALVQVRIIHGNFWDVQESKIVQFFEIAKAAVTGKPPRSLGESGKIDMR